MRRYFIMCLIIVSILGVYLINTSFAKYQKELKSNTITISSEGYTDVEATISAVEDENNTFTVNIINNNDYDVRYRIKEENDLYNVEYNSSNDEYVTVSANTTDTVSIVVNGRDDVVYEDMETDSEGLLYKEINIVIEAIKPYKSGATELATAQRIYLGQSAKNNIILNAGGITHYEEGYTFTGVSASDESSLCAIADPVSGDTIHFYRGNVTNNYVSFAGKTWRILRINSDGSLRLILDDSISTSSYQDTNTPTENTIESAIELANWQNSNVYNILQTWYSNNIATSYSDYIVQTNFVFDKSYQLETSSATGVGCYYFGPYLRVGIDGNQYQPTFSYNDESLVQDNIGLITSDEILYAGGYWGTNNTSYFLYNSSITTVSWTMSPSFWDNGAHYKLGMMILGSSGRVHDWPASANTLTESLGIRPVISIRGDLEMSGDGTVSNPYQYE